MLRRTVECSGSMKERDKSLRAFFDFVLKNLMKSLQPSDVVKRHAKGPGGD